MPSSKYANPNEKQISFSTDPQIIQDLKRIAFERNTTMKDLIVEGIKGIIEKNKQYLKH